MIRIKRVYDPPDLSDGFRFLVDRLWPRGVKKDAVKRGAWLRDVAPSDALRRRFAHDPERNNAAALKSFLESKLQR